MTLIGEIGVRSIRLFFCGIIGVGSTTLDVPLNVFIGGPILADVIAFVSIKGHIVKLHPKVEYL